jgi:hypothetical protein
MKTWKAAFASLLLMGCAGMSRDCSSCWASSTGGDWIIVQYRTDGTPINCWELRNSPVANEQGTDGIYWQDPGGHLVHISGWYNRVQVQGERWEEAARTLGIDDARCKGGVYLPAKDAGATQTGSKSDG